MFRSLLTAVRHLSVIPLGERFRKVTEGREGEILVFFPFAGLIVAVVPAAVLVLANLAAPAQATAAQLLPAALVVAAFAIITGGTNLISLAATADAAASGKAGAEALNADPLERIAAPGAVAAGLALLVKFAAVASLPGQTAAIVAILLAGMLSRWAAVVLAAYSEYPRPEGGDDEWMVRYCGARELRWSLVPAATVVAVAALAKWNSADAVTWLVQVVLATLGCLAVAYCASLYFERRFGGVTGRQLGAVIEIAEVVALAICAMPAARLLPVSA